MALNRMGAMFEIIRVAFAPTGAVVTMGSGKGNKHSQKRVYKKNWVGSKWWIEAQEARKTAHRRKAEKKDRRMRYFSRNDQ